MLKKCRSMTLGVAALVALSVAGCASNGITAPAPLASTPAPASTPSAIPTSTTVITPGPSPAPLTSANTINIAFKTPLGNYLVDGRGLTLYYTVSDRAGYSNLPDEALSSWPAFYVSNIAVPPALKASDFGTYTRDNKVKQTTYKGYPLYYFFQDKASGDTLGNKLGGVWFVIDPENFPPR